LNGRQPKAAEEATMPYRLIGTAIAFVLVAAVICYFTGPIGIFYAAGLVVFQWVAEGFAAILDPKTFAQNKPPADSR
jgi:hypothetical protein